MSRTANRSPVALGQVIQSAREAIDMTQDELAAALGLTQQSVSRWESGQMIPGIEKMPKIAAVLKIDVSELSTAAFEQVAKNPPSSPQSNASRLEALERENAAMRAELDRVLKLLGAKKPAARSRQRA